MVFLYLDVQIYSTLKRGDTHPLHCDDFLIQKQIAPNLWIGAVMDGCSSGINSYFAATLFGKLLSKVFTTLQYPQVVGFNCELERTQKVMEFVCQSFYKEVNLAKNHLFLERNELLSTLILAVYKPITNELSIMAAGDGVYSVNGGTVIIDQENKPNYVAYHIDKGFETWYAHETILEHYSGVDAFAISTDGVESFAKETLDPDNDDFDAVKYLLTEDSLSENPAMLHKKCLLLQKERQLIPRDDVAIIRVINRQ